MFFKSMGLLRAGMFAATPLARFAPTDLVLGLTSRLTLGKNPNFKRARKRKLARHLFEVKLGQNHRHTTSRMMKASGR